MLGESLCVPEVDAFGGLSIICFNRHDMLIW